MSEMAGSVTLPMEADGTQHLVERTYREGAPLQWVRETDINANEADATQIEFGIEWQAVENHGIYRRTIADNGCGMTADELVGFFNTFGGGGKPIGGAHENFGVGSKTSLMPWNRYGLVVVSWVDGEASMIWLHQDPDSGAYGLRLFEAEDPETGETSLEHVFEPFDDPDHGCDWSEVRPDWIGDHGTVIVLLGNDATQDTVLGDPGREESDIKGISAYLNRRIWDVGEVVTVDELRSNERATWPRDEEEATGTEPAKGPDRRTNRRTILGAKYFIEYPRKAYKRGRLAHSGTCPLSDGTEIDWYLWDGKRPAVQSYAAISGYIAALYRDELYNVQTHHSTYRMFGISESKVRSNLWLVIRPPEAGGTHGGHGVYPRTDRNSLLLQGGASAGQPLPFEDWAAEFADQMPEQIRAAIKAARGSEAGTIDDDSWRERLADRFGARWKITRRRVGPGPHGVTPTSRGSRPKKARRVVRNRPGGSGGQGGRGGTTNTGAKPGRKPARNVDVPGGIPTFRIVGDEDLSAGMIAAWQPHDPEHAEGVVLINRDHPVLVELVRSWQDQYADHHGAEIEHDVLNVYGEFAVAKIAHSEHLKSILPSHVVETELRSETALTMALLGLIGEEAVIAPRVGGKYAKRRKSAAE